LPEWLYEAGIGETRAALIEEGEIVEAWIELDEIVRAGSVLAARLANVGINGRNAVAVDDQGREYLLPRGAPEVTEGAPITIEITRGEIPGNEPWKRPLARISDEQPQPAKRSGGRAITLPSPRDELGEAGWNDLIDQARNGIVGFAGGELRLSVTPAMTLIDVDGSLAPDELVVRGAAEAAKAIRRLDIGGSIGIDLPTTSAKAARQLAAAAIDKHLSQPFERTAINGFGFVQIVRPRRRASLLELAQDRAAFEARALLRHAAFEPAGAKTLVAHPAIVTILKGRDASLATLARQVGGDIGLRGDASLPISGAYAENR
jgi:hypothetical protein